MIRPDQIPDEVVEAALKKRGLMREAIADALNAWPGAKPHKVQVPDDTSDDIRYVLKTVGIILPLPTEASDE